MKRFMYIACILGIIFILGACASTNDDPNDNEEAGVILNKQPFYT